MDLAQLADRLERIIEDGRQQAEDVRHEQPDWRVSEIQIDYLEGSMREMARQLREAATGAFDYDRPAPVIVSHRDPDPQ